MMTSLIRLLALGLLGASAQAMAGEAEIRQAFAASFEVQPTSVSKTTYGGLWEIYHDGEIFYADDKATFIILGGSLLDIKAKKNVTEQRLAKLTAIKFSDLPLNAAIKTVRGKGTRVFATFEDPLCGYCKRFARDLQGLEDYTMYTFLYPILAPDSFAKSKAIWCSDNRQKAWIDWMVNNTAPKGEGKCDNPVDENVELGKKFRINGTPAIILSNGERIGGAIPVAELDKRLKEVAQSAAKVK
jgi:thiol:disulfide interchange protein DsbC